ncbi:ATP-dependent DNA helicase RecG [Candidatus Tisiphia endosymbiont of Ptychoptera albimana]|uniref:ATP-dependent DNA helicase RecG n=1 Tax=Candidatus Tisiphia endosymbiont of Ptychoptera albimana TaxID=3066260 RepID=UPI001E011647|nr:ATP-dependent DNA helicase RecG [Rickettsia endosymbiont of Sericostoma sp. HW-2014]
MLTISKFFFLPIKSHINVSDNIIDGLKRLGIINLRDLLFYRPTSYQVKTISPNLSLLKNGQLIQAEVTIEEILVPKSRKQPLKILVSNETGSILLIFFNRPPYFLLNKLTIGSKQIIEGKVQIFSSLAQISHPIFIFDKKLTNSIQSIYPLTYGIINKQLYSYIIKAIDLLEKECNSIPKNFQEIKDYIESLLNDLKIMHLYQVHDTKLQTQSLRRLAARELFANQLSLQHLRQQTKLKQGNSFTKSVQLQQSILKILGFELTYDQKKVIEEIEKDQLSPTEMMRLLQGDVGSGKTLVALLTIVNVVYHKFQAALMAPTDLLANQHHQFFVKALSESGIKIGLLTGKISSKERNKLLSELENGDIDILIGTHALFQEKVIFKNLGYIVIDEQHKFGVQQRLDLINKASYPDVLVMTATPIPRSLTLTMFGDMDISKLTSKPKNRLPIITSILPKTKLNNVISVLDKKLTSGEKIYWICPLIDQTDEELVTQEKNTRPLAKLAYAEEFEGDAERRTAAYSNVREDSSTASLSKLPSEVELGKRSTGLTDVNTRFITIETAYPNITTTIHGKMKNEQKDAIMQQFKNGNIKILIATTVIEVGIDVPDATLIVIENAEQFGLAQLHQIRGRVGRGMLQSHCILLYDPQKLTILAKSRFEVMRNSNDGFYIAEQDLLLRGSGEILGTKQSGEIRFFFADLARDLDLLTKANKLAEESSNNHSELLTLQTKLFAKVEFNELN